jgi:hypothetical protein
MVVKIQDFMYSWTVGSSTNHGQGKKMYSNGNQPTGEHNFSSFRQIDPDEPKSGMKMSSLIEFGSVCAKIASLIIASESCLEQAQLHLSMHNPPVVILKGDIDAKERPPQRMY